MPWHIRLICWTGAAILFFSITLISESKPLRRTAITIMIIVVISAAWVIIFHNADHVSVPAWMIILLSSPVLFGTAIAAVIPIITS